MTAQADPPAPKPPVAERRPFELAAHGRRRTDDYYWLADRDDPAVLAHLEAENAYTEAALEPLAGLRERLYQEMVARIVETDVSVPVRRGPWWYYQRTLEGSDYAIHCRRPAADDDEPPEVADDPAAAPSGEQVVLDENELARGQDYLSVGNLSVSPDHRWLAVAVDLDGAERHRLTFGRLDGASGAGHAGDEPRADETIEGTYYGLVWAEDNRTVFYSRVDQAMRPCELWRHRLGTDPAHDVLVLSEPDERFTLGVGRTRNRRFIVVELASTTSSECWVIPADAPEAEARLVAARRPDVEYSVEHLAPGGGPGQFLVVTNDGARDFRLMATAEDTTGAEHWRQVLAERPGTRLDGVEPFDRWLAVTERLDAESRVRVVPLAEGPDPLAGDRLAASWLVAADEQPATTWTSANPESSTRWLRIEQSSLASPRSVVDLDPATRTGRLRKRQPVRGPFRPEDYRTYRTWAPAPDGTAVPVSVVHHRALLADPDAPAGTAPGQPAPCVLYGYGAYEHSIDPAFSSLCLSLLERGVVYAIVHARGGGELGRAWYEDGKLSAKPHTFDDVVAAARHLVAAGISAPDRLALRGASAGGLLVGAVLNRAPELFRAAVAQVPFVDCLTTMCDASLPLTVGEWEEWGNPVADPGIFDLMASYSPYDNVASATAGGSPVRYPDLLVTGGLNDQRVGYWEPAKWVARLRHANRANRVLLRTELGAGHGGPSGRYDSWREEALIVAFLLDALGLAGAPRIGGS